MRDTLIFGQAYQGGPPLDPMAAVAALPDEAEICGCNGVCKGKIVRGDHGEGLTASTTCAPTPRPRPPAARAPGWSSSCWR
jgi:NAD(P)H-nitrite reductase large subunit